MACIVAEPFDYKMQLMFNHHFVSRCTVTVLAFQNQVLMPLVLRRDFLAFEALIKSIETSQASPWLNVFYKVG